MKKNNNGIGIIVRLFGREFKVDLSFSSNIITNNTQPKLSNEDRQSKKNLMSEKDSQNALSDIENEIDEIDKNVIGHLSSDIGRVLNNAEIVESNPNDKGIPIEVDNNNK